MDVHNIHNPISYDFAFGRDRLFEFLADSSTKINTLVSTTRLLMETVFFPNIVNTTYISPQQQLLIPLVFFTSTDTSSAHHPDFQQELEETKMKLRKLFKNFLRTRRFQLITEVIHLQSSASLMNSIRSTFIDTVSLVSRNNSVTLLPIRRIVQFSTESRLGWRRAFARSPDSAAAALRHSEQREGGLYV